MIAIVSVPWERVGSAWIYRFQVSYDGDLIGVAHSHREAQAMIVDHECISRIRAQP